MLLTWVFTVSGDSQTWAAISALDSPSASALQPLPVGRPPTRIGLEQPTGHGGCHQRVSGEDRANAVDELLRSGSLEQESVGPGVQGIVDHFVEVERGQDEDAGAARPRDDLAGSAHPV